MRRSDKEITDPHKIDEIIGRCLVCRLALAKDNIPYLVPVSFGYDGKAIYFHTATSGKKIGYFQASQQVCFEFESNVELRRDPATACKWSMNYESVIGFGSISELVDLAEKKRGLNEVMLHYSGRCWPFEGREIESVRVWRIAITSMTGKQSKPKTATGEIAGESSTPVPA